MREYKFKGKRKNDGEWVYGFYVHIAGRHVICDKRAWIEDDHTTIHGYWNVDPATVGQYTSLKDKDGKEIYEGDIMEWYSACVAKGTNPHLRTVVKWNKLKASFGGCFNGGEVIGNIHDKPKVGL